MRILNDHDVDDDDDDVDDVDDDDTHPIHDGRSSSALHYPPESMDWFMGKPRGNHRFSH